MSVVDVHIGEARRMSEFMLGRKFRGPGDTIERAAYEVEKAWGAPASIMLRLRRRSVSDMLLSNWLLVKQAYDSACSQLERQADHQEYLAREAGIHEGNSSFAKAASVVAGAEEGGAK